MGSLGLVPKAQVRLLDQPDNKYSPGELERPKRASLKIRGDHRRRMLRGEELVKISDPTCQDVEGDESYRQGDDGNRGRQVERKPVCMATTGRGDFRFRQGRRRESNRDRKGKEKPQGSKEEGRHLSRSGRQEFKWKRKEEVSNGFIDRDLAPTHPVQKDIVIREGEGPMTKGAIQTHKGKGKLTMEFEGSVIVEEDSDLSLTELG